MKAALLSLRMETVSGFDVSSLNAYRWHPQAARLLELAREPHLLLSDVFEVTARGPDAPAEGEGEG